VQFDGGSFPGQTSTVLKEPVSSYNADWSMSWKPNLLRERSYKVEWIVAAKSRWQFAR